jgi:glyoxylase-like metal-dependent hydrolase (beta-lactamase superfamily II)
MTTFSHPSRPFVLSAIAAMVFASTAAMAAAPMAKTNAPGFHRFMLGDFEVTAVSDGTVELPVNTLLMEKQAKVDKALAKSFMKSPAETSVNAFVINTGTKLVMIDAGAGGLFGPTLGKLVANLKASGYQPEQIDEIYITHLHPDHVGGLAANGAVVFPNAIVRADKHDTDYWLSQANMDKAPAEGKGFFQGAMASMNPYNAAQHLKPFEGDTELVPGVKAVSRYGHTPGHTNYVVESKGQKLVLVGDLIHVGAVQFDDPAVTIKFDSDAKAAAAARKLVFDAAATDGAMIGASHLQFPGLGHLRKEGKGYEWVPVNYTQVH